MKKIILLLAAFTMVSASFTSCDTYRSVASATKISQLSANPFMQRVARTVVTEMGRILVQNGLKNALPKLNLNTNLTSLLTSPVAIESFKGMLTNKFGLSTGMVENNMPNLVNLKDVVNLVSKNSTIKF